MAGAVIAAPTGKKRAPTLYAIIVMKLLKGLLFLTLAVVAYCLSDNDLPAEFQKLINTPWFMNLMETIKVHPGNKFFTSLAEQIGNLTEAKVLWAAGGTFIYSLFSLVEGFGLMFRVSWAGWLAIGESAFFIPIELYDVVRHFKWSVMGVLIFNIVVVWYLFENRERLFKHHQSDHGLQWENLQ